LDEYNAKLADSERTLAETSTYTWQNLGQRLKRKGDDYNRYHKLGGIQESNVEQEAPKATWQEL
jgi:hypothetical protein